MTEFELQVLARLDVIGESLVGPVNMKPRVESRMQELRIEDRDRRIKELQARMGRLGYVGGRSE